MQGARSGPTWDSAFSHRNATLLRMESSSPMPPDLSPSLPPDATPQQGVAAYLDLLDACEQFLLAGLRREIGPDGDLKAAYRKWAEERDEEHYQCSFT
jgi:hypothetical protein